MNVFYFGAVLCLATGLTVAYATIGGQQYSVNVHFVPPLVSARCTIAQFWYPSNVTCALCFCMTGTLSRCIPQPGCNPSNATNNATTTTTTASPTGSSSSPASAVTTVASDAAAEANHQAVTDQVHITPNPTQAPTSDNPTTQGQVADTTNMPFSLNLVRRRRGSMQI